MIKVNFTDFWPGFDDNNLFLKFLEKHYDISISNKPDYLFYSVHGNSHLKYKDCIKIFYTGENLVPDFNLCDYALGFQYIDFGDRYLRFPLYVYYQWNYSEILQPRSKSKINHNYSDEELLKRKFCNFVYSNNFNSDPGREIFFHKLSKYKRVDSGGRFLNNIGNPVINKLDFIKDYKFTMAFENSSVSGYTTEKLLEPIIINSLPIYFGNPLVNMDYRADTFINIKDQNDFDRAIEEIIFLDNNDDIYLEKLKLPKFNNENNIQNWEKKLLLFINNIFNQPLSVAKRIPVNGFTKFYLEELSLKSQLLEDVRRKNLLKGRLKKIFDKLLSVSKSH